MRITHLLLGMACTLAVHAQDAAWEEKTIAPVANPIFFESPHIQSEVRPLFGWHRFDEDFLGTDVDVRVYAVQLRYALTEKLALIANKDGWIEVDPDRGRKTEGWADIGAGLKYAIYRNDEQQILITPGATFEFPTGDDDVFQGNGDGEFNLFIAAVKGFDNFHATVNLGGRIPIDQDEETSKIRYSAMLDYYTCQYFIPFVCLNGFTTVSEGKAVPIDSEGFDLINFGSTNADGKSQWAAGVGFRSRIVKNVDLGFAYENGFSPDDDVFRDRYTVDLIWRF